MTVEEMYFELGKLLMQGKQKLQVKFFDDELQEYVYIHGAEVKEDYHGEFYGLS